MPAAVEDVDVALPDWLAVGALVYELDGHEGGAAVVLLLNSGAQLLRCKFRYIRHQTNVNGQVLTANFARCSCLSRISSIPKSAPYFSSEFVIL